MGFFSAGALNARFDQSVNHYTNSVSGIWLRGYWPFIPGDRIYLLSRRGDGPCCS